MGGDLLVRFRRGRRGDRRRLLRATDDDDAPTSGKSDDHRHVATIVVAALEVVVRGLGDLGLLQGDVGRQSQIDHVGQTSGAVVHDDSDRDALARTLAEPRRQLGVVLEQVHLSQQPTSSSA